MRPGSIIGKKSLSLKIRHYQVIIIKKSANILFEIRKVKVIMAVIMNPVIKWQQQKQQKIGGNYQYF